MYNIDQRPDIIKQTIGRKTMITLFFKGEGLQFLQIKPSGLKINEYYYIINVIKKLEVLGVDLKALNQKQQMLIHFGNIPFHYANSVNNYIIHSPFTRMPHPVYKCYLTSCDFAILGTIKEDFEGHEFEKEDELHSAIDEFLN